MSKITKAGAAGAVAFAIWALTQGKTLNMVDWRTLLSQIRIPSSNQAANSNLWWGFAIATAVEASASLGLATYMYSKFDVHSAHPRYKARRVARPDRFVSVRRDAAKTIATGSGGGASAVLDAKQYRPFKLVRKTVIGPNVYRMVFALPGADAVLGLPTGQHIALQAVIGGRNVARSYTPISNNSDLGRIELLIKVYPQGLMTQHLANMRVGETIDVRGPKGSMQYGPTYAKHIGMVAGGSGITPSELSQGLLQ
jgi:cytochrome-b5 reductase